MDSNSQSQYWKGKRDTYAASKTKNETLKSKYEDFLERLENLSNIVNSATTYLNTCNNKFSSGGYVNAGKGLYSDKISGIISTLDSNNSIITKSINFCTERIKVLVKTIADYESKRQYAHSQYIYYSQLGGGSGTKISAA